MNGKPKERCEKCGRMLRIKHFVINKVTGEKMCTMCDKRIGSNKFYIPKEQRRERIQRISRFNITDDEKKVIARKSGWNKVNQDLKILDSMKKRKSKERREQHEEEIKKKDMNKKLIEGLKEYSK